MEKRGVIDPATTPDLDPDEVAAARERRRAVERLAAQGPAAALSHALDAAFEKAALDREAGRRPHG